MQSWTSDHSFTQPVCECPSRGVLQGWLGWHGWCHVKLLPFGTCSVYPIQPCTSLQCHFIQSYIHRVHVCLAVTHYLHFWQNDQDLLCASAWRVDRGEENSAAPQTCDLLITSFPLYHWAVHAPLNRDKIHIWTCAFHCVSVNTLCWFCGSHNTKETWK